MYHRFERILLLALLVSSQLALGPRAIAGVVISELMYHPGSDETAEFVELFNTDASAVNLEDWCFDGIDFCFGPGATLGPIPSRAKPTTIWFVP